MDHFIQKLSK